MKLKQVYMTASRVKELGNLIKLANGSFVQFKIPDTHERVRSGKLRTGDLCYDVLDNEIVESSYRSVTGVKDMAVAAFDFVLRGNRNEPGYKYKGRCYRFPRGYGLVVTGVVNEGDLLFHSFGGSGPEFKPALSMDVGAKVPDKHCVLRLAQ